MLSNIIDRIKLPFRKEKELYSALYDILGVYPRNITYYKVALMHKSLGHRATAEEIKAFEGKKTTGSKYVKDSRQKNSKHSADGGKNGGKNGKGKQRNGGKQEQGKLGKQLNNERLEFLGDAILDAVVGDIVYQHYNNKPEGFLTNTRSKLVQRETLGKLAQQMGISRLIMASSRTATHNSYIGGNAFEALVGALYLDRGYEACYKFWANRIMGKFLDIDKVAYKEVNFKSKILEWSQKNRITLNFRLEDQSQDVNGSPKFVYTVVLEDVDGCTAEGFSKKEAQQKACELTLKKLRGEHKFLDSIFKAKTARTKMDEDPTMAVPNVEEQSPVIAVQQVEEAPAPQPSEAVMKAEQAVDELNLDDVTNSPHEKTREEIIAEAEAQAYQ